MLAVVPQWVPLLAPFAGVVTAAVGLFAAFKPWLAERKKKEGELARQLGRGENALSLIFGVEEDKSRGVLPQKGILDRLDEQDANLERLAKTVGEVSERVRDIQDRETRQRGEAG